MSAATNLPERIFAFYIDKIFMNCITYPVSYLVFVLFLKTASNAFKRVELSTIWIFLHNLQKRTIEINKGAQISVRPRIKEKKQYNWIQPCWRHSNWTKDIPVHTWYHLRRENWVRWHSNEQGPLKMLVRL